MLLAHRLQLDSNCVDVGAHTGTVLTQILRYAPAGEHVAFEPLPAQAGILRDAFPSVQVHQAAVGASAGTAEFTHVTGSPELSGLRDRGFSAQSEVFEVAIRTLDDSIEPARKIDFIKIDVEGGELDVLKGGKRLLLRDRPLIAFEHGVGGSEHFGVTSGDVHDFLTHEVGYRVFDIDGAGPLTRPEFESLFSKRIWFFVAHP